MGGRREQDIGYVKDMEDVEDMENVFKDVGNVM